MENKLTQELIEKAKQAKTPEEIAALAKEIGAEMTPEEANTYFAMLNPKTGELADDELEDVAGGRKCGTTYQDHRPVVTSYNSCDLFQRGPVRDEKGEEGKCKDCYYQKEGDFFLTCLNPKRYDN